MTTLDIGTLQVNNPEIKNKTIDEIKEILTLFLEENFTKQSKPISKKNLEEIEKIIKNSKVTNKEKGGKFGESLRNLKKEFEKIGKMDYANTELELDHLST